ncbi:MAG: hypothetical protein H6831_11080 [Planctomycetes bacterium]|nr:hypothetical protein [Planctomycetota bacterium]MCB9904941.1 hypothetical protein [Planctomycetota bacterium]
MTRRILAILRARLAAQFSGGPPWAALLAQGSFVAVMCLLARDTVGPWGYAMFALSLSGGLVLLSLLGEFGGILRRDPAGEWAEALPSSELERRLAHFALIAVLLSGLTLAMGLPAVLFAPATLGALERALLLVAVLAQSIGLAASLLAIAALLGERAEGLLVLLQTAIVAVAVTATFASLRLLGWLRAFESGEVEAPQLLAWLPSTHVASSITAPPLGLPHTSPGLPLVVALAGAVLLTAIPPAHESRGRRSRTPLARLLAPLAALAARFWVRDDERASFHLVSEALPLERDFVLRTYPMVGLPLAFFLAGAKGDAGPAREGLLAVLLFTPAIYLPILLAHVPATSSPRARWILESAPVTRAAIRGGAIKALAVRFLVPLFVVLGGLAAALAGLDFALRLTPAGFLITLVVMRVLYPQVVRDNPLSVPADEVEVQHDWMGMLATLAVGLVVLATLAQYQLASTPARALAFTALALAVEWRTARADRRAVEPA